MKVPVPTPATSNEDKPDGPIASAVRALPAGASVDEFEIGEIIGNGGTTIVYAATDRGRAVPVAIAEYMPANLAQRHHESQVAPRTPAQADAFAKGLKAFSNETRTLARCNHPSLVRIVRLSEANGTAYRVMPRYTAARLLEVRRSMNEPPDEAAVRALLDALLGALGAFHLAGGVHGKVTPFNILLVADDQPLLLAPGGAGRAIAGDRIDALMISEEPCFAPIEQMVESADISLHPSVDLYALAGVARYWISGELPAPAFGTPDSPRREKLVDTVQRLRVTWPRLHYSAALLDALDSALSIYPAERPKDVAQMRARLGTAPAAAGGPASAASTAASALNDGLPTSHPALNETVPASPGLLPEPTPPDQLTPDLDVVTLSTPDPEPPATSGLARIDDDDLSAQTAFARQVRHSRRIAKRTGAVLAVLAVLVVGVFEFGREGQFGRVLDVLGIHRGATVGDSPAVSESGMGPAAPPPIAADSPASATVPPSPAGAPITADAGGAKPMPTEAATADSPASGTAPAATAGAQVAADAGAAKAVPKEPNAANSPAGATAPASPAGPDSATLSAAAPAASPEPAAIAPPPAALTPPPMRSAQQRASRAPATPREACGPRTQFSLYRCMKMQCSQRRWASHAQCARLRITDSVD